MILNILSFSLLISFIGFVLSLFISQTASYERIGVLLAIFILSIALSTMKWNRCMQIKKIFTGKSKTDNRAIIERFIQDKGFIYRHHNADYIQVISKNVFLWLTMEFNFIIRESEIYININYFDARANWPSVFRVKRYINEIKTNINASP